jgi:hypothetical protein
VQVPHEAAGLAEKGGQKRKHSRLFIFFLPPFFCQPPSALAQVEKLRMKNSTSSVPTFVGLI